MTYHVVWTLPTTNRESTRRFYEDVLEFEHIADHNRAGNFTLDLLRHRSGAIIEIVAGPPISGDIGSGAPFLSLFVPEIGL